MQKTEVTIKYKMKFIDNYKFMSNTLLSLTDAKKMY